MNLYEESSLNYSDIFNKRGLDYHKAMLLLPHSRDNEFLNIASQVAYLPKMTIIDIPSGGNYLKIFLPDQVTVIPLETSQVFADIGNSRICDWSHLPFEDNTIDVVFCCAAFHHVSDIDRLKFKNEVIRVLKPNGKLVIADVQEDSKIDKFLNGFVNDKNSMGHNGQFLETSFSVDFATNNFIVDKDVIVDFPWILSFKIEESMRYVQLLFGLDKANIEQIKNYLNENLNLKRNQEDKFQMDWQLRYVTFKKV